MSNFSKFMKSNKIRKENVFYAPTKSLTDENGEPLLWEFKHLASRDVDLIRDECLTISPTGNKAKFNSSKFTRMMIVESTVNPDLDDAELQDSYGVKSSCDLILEMVDDPGEYNKLAEFIQQLNGFSESLDDKVDEAKN